VVLDAAIVAAVVDVPAVGALLAIFLFFPGVSLMAVAWITFGLSLCGLLCRDVRGGLSRKWLGFQIEDARGRPPGIARSAARNLPLLIPGWNVYEAWRALRGRARSVDRALGLRVCPSS
jgi:hypothetical protein